MPTPRLPFLPQNITIKNFKTLLRLRIMAQAPPPNRPIKVLMLHGFTQSGPLFQAKTGALRKTLAKAFPAGISLSYPTGPIRLAHADVPFAVSQSEAKGNEGGEEHEVEAYGWWRRKDDKGSYTYDGIEKGMGHIAEILKTEGPFDGVVGFSQGGACAAMLASLLEPGRKEAFEALYPKGGMQYPESFEGPVHPPLKFAVSYSGFAPRDQDLHRAFYEPKIKTPMLHFIGTLDTVVEESRSLALVDACENSEGKVVYHPGGHFLPSTQKASVGALIGFIKETLHAAEGEEKKEESVEDMDVPF